MKCPNCGADSTGKICEYCGSELPYNGPQVQNTYNTENVPQHVTNVYYVNSPQTDSTSLPADFPPAPIAGTADPAQSSDQYKPFISGPSVSNKNKNTALLLCFFLGFYGVHLFYVGRWKKGLIYLLTGGLFCFGWLFDLFTISVNRFNDANDLPLTGNAKKAWLVIIIAVIFIFIATLIGNSQ